MKITVNVALVDLVPIQAFLDSTRPHAEKTISSHGELDLQKLVAMLLQDVALMVNRPGSWEGANMAQVMASHGYADAATSERCAAARQIYLGRRT